MARFLRTPAGQLLAAYLLLDLVIWAYTGTAGSRLNAGTNLTVQQIGWTAFDAFFVWRVWRRSRIAWAILLVINCFIAVELFFGLSRLTGYATGLWVIILAQLVILLTPAVRRHIRRGQRVRV